MRCMGNQCIYFPQRQVALDAIHGKSLSFPLQGTKKWISLEECSNVLLQHQTEQF